VSRVPRESLGSGDWRAGQRVVREDSDEQGTIVEVDGEIKVKWDRGRTSYYRRGVPANVRLAHGESASSIGAFMDRKVDEAARPSLSRKSMPSVKSK